MMKTTLSVLACAILCTSCTFAFRSNLTYIRHKNSAEFEGSVTDKSRYDNGQPSVNADKTFSDLLNNSGNNNGARKAEEPAEPTPEPTPAD